jgi:hypothetical protein
VRIPVDAGRRYRGLYFPTRGKARLPVRKRIEAEGFSDRQLFGNALIRMERIRVRFPRAPPIFPEVTISGRPAP